MTDRKLDLAVTAGARNRLGQRAKPIAGISVAYNVVEGVVAIAARERGGLDRTRGIRA